MTTLKFLGAGIGAGLGYIFGGKSIVSPTASFSYAMY